MNELNSQWDIIGSKFYFENDDDLDPLKWNLDGEDTDEENMKLDVATTVTHMMDKMGLEKSKSFFNQMDKIERGFIPWPPHVEYDELLFNLLNEKFFEFLPMCKNLYITQDKKYTFVFKKESTVERINVKELPILCYRFFKSFIAQNNYTNHPLDFDVFYGFIKWVFFATFQMMIKDYFVQLFPVKREVLFEVDIDNCMPLKAHNEKRVKRIYVLNLYNNNRTNLTRLNNLQNFTVLGFISVRYPKYKYKKKKIIWEFGKRKSKIDKKDTIFVFLKIK